MLVALQVVTVAVVPLNFTVLVPLVEPKFVPVIVTEAPTAPEVGDKVVMLGPAALPTAGHSEQNAHNSNVRVVCRRACKRLLSGVFTVVVLAYGFGRTTYCVVLKSRWNSAIKATMIITYILQSTVTITNNLPP